MIQTKAWEGKTLMACFMLFIAWHSLSLLNLQGKENAICNYWMHKANTQRGISCPHPEPQQRAELLSALCAGRPAFT